MDQLEWFIDNLPQIIEGITMIVGGFAVIATLTPNEHDNVIVKKTLDAINVLGANVGNAKNQE